MNFRSATFRNTLQSTYALITYKQTNIGEKHGLKTNSNMGTKLNHSAFKKLIDEDINWLLTHTEDCLERNHIVSVLTYSKFLSKNGQI